MSGTPLVQLSDDLWTATGLMPLPGGVRLPVRMTVARLPDGALWLHSPLRPRDELVAAVRALGPVKALVAPSRSHHLHVGAWRALCPDARVWAAPGVAAKRPDLVVDEELGASEPASWGAVIAPFPIEGAPAMNEFVFLHRPSRTLIVCDLVFNIVKPANLMTALAISLTGVRGKLAVSRVWRFVTKDRAALGASVRRVLDQDFARLLPAHGDIVETDARAAFADVSRWLCGK